MPKKPINEPISDKIDFGQLEILIRKGFTDKEIAKFFDINYTTFQRWKKDPEFKRLLKNWKEYADDNVERSLYERATGYNHPAIKIFQHNGRIIKAKYTAHVPPDTGAAIFWLKNRQRDRWKDNWNNLGDFSDDELKGLKELAADKMKASV